MVGPFVLLMFVLMLFLWNELSKVKNEVKSLKERLGLDGEPRNEGRMSLGAARDSVTVPRTAVRLRTLGGVVRSSPWDGHRTMDSHTAVTKRDETPDEAVSVPARDAEPAPKASEPQGLESLFGRTLPIWAGGLTLAITGILGLKWSIDAGILSEGVRVLLGLLFGGALIGGGFLMADREDDGVAQALSGAGIASLYGAVLSAYLLYELIGAGAAMGGMIAVTLIGGALSMRFGAPCALLALFGGLAAPALIGGNGNVPLLTLYVMAITGGAAFLARLQDRVWLSLVALGGGFVWVMASAAMADNQGALVFVVGLALFAGIAVPLIATGRSDGSASRSSWIGALVSTVQCAGLVVMGGYGSVQWVGLMIATIACLLLSSKRNMGILPPLAGGVALITLLSWRDAATMDFVIAVLAFGAVHAVHAFGATTRRIEGGHEIRLMAVPVAAAFLLVIHRMPESGLASGVICLVAAGILAAIIEMIRAKDDKSGEADGVFQVIGVGLASFGIWWSFGEVLFPLGVSLMGALALFRRGWLASLLTSIAVVAGASVIALSPWMAGGLKSLAGVPFFASDLPSSGATLRSLVPLAVVSGLAAWKLRDRVRAVSVVLGAAAAASVTVLIHFSWKSIVGIEDAQDFIEYGMLERTVWEGLLAVLAVVILKFDRRYAMVLGGMALAHFCWYSLLLHNPLWSEQAVGPAPVANLVGISFALAFGLLVQGGRMVASPAVHQALRVGQMGVVAIGALMLVRQMFTGSIMVGFEVGQTENITYSIAAIGVALGMLVYGIRTSSMDWRIGSLALMLMAVLKVFLFDAAGLDGFARIISFAALGFALIGVGWLYAKLLSNKE